MPLSVKLRVFLAATALLLVLASSYELAVHWAPKAPATAERQGVTRPGADRPLASTPPPQAPPAATSEVPPCPAHPLRFVPPDSLNRPPVTLHRYVGTVGGQPATVLLHWSTSLGSLRGSFYLHPGGPQHTLTFRSRTRRPPLLDVTNHIALTDDELDGDLGTWQLTGWPGPVLHGTWRTHAGTRSVWVRESYAGGVRLDVHTLQLAGGQSYPASPQSGLACEGGSYTYDYVQFPAPKTVAPALRRAIGSPPAVVRRRLRAAYEDVRSQSREIVDFLLDDFNLLSYQVACSSTMAGDGGKGDDWAEYFLFDLVSGRELTLASQLRPGYERPLWRLTRRHLLHDPQFDFINRAHHATWAWQDARDRVAWSGPRLEAGRDKAPDHTTPERLTGSGLEITYMASNLYESHEPGESSRKHTLVIPYTDLRPLVRPGTPLARMLRARGLW